MHAGIWATQTSAQPDEINTSIKLLHMPKRKQKLFCLVFVQRVKQTLKFSSKTKVILSCVCKTCEQALTFSSKTDV